MSNERSCTNAIVITMIVTMRLENKKSRVETTTASTSFRDVRC